MYVPSHVEIKRNEIVYKAPKSTVTPSPPFISQVQMILKISFIKPNSQADKTYGIP